MKRASVVLMSLIAVAALSACGTGPDSPAGEEAVLMRVHDIPDGYEKKIENLMNRLLSGQEGPGRVQAAPGGKLVVLGTESVQDGVERLLEGLPSGGTPASPPPPPGLKMTYWVVAGRASGDDASGVGASEIAEVLRRVEEVQGPMAFRILERLELLGSSGKASVQGNIAHVHQSPQLVDGRIVSQVGVALRERAMFNNATTAQVSTVLRLRPGQTVVLASAALSLPNWPDLFEGMPGEGPFAFYYIVRGDLTE